MGHRLHGLGGLQGLAGGGGAVGHQVLRQPRQAAHLAAQDQDREHHQRHDQQCHAGQLGRGDQQHHNAAGQQQDVAQSNRGAGADDRLDHRGVGGQPGHHLGRHHPLEKSRAHPRDMAEDSGAQIGDDPLAQTADQVEAHRGGQRQ